MFFCLFLLQTRDKNKSHDCDSKGRIDVVGGVNAPAGETDMTACIVNHLLYTALQQGSASRRFFQQQLQITHNAFMCFITFI